MYLIVIAWMYVVLMMSVAEATHPTGTLLGAMITFVLYGVGPLALVVYLMRAPARRKAIKAREAAEAAEAAEATTLSPSLFERESLSPDAGRHAAGGVEPIAGDTGVAPVRKKP
ncbi:hypothetical protein [Polaromonas sp. A23]|uniref:hypothetical protein n=1 Tax=Polaromonas sp. A23 TaxID=1944133 RepID=UPI0009873171|nr:hypothetical protein [Polaromonas sp. A23]OOG35951.1 hypothetical protein B0B52_21845 [Polaromonas sp. A23]